MSGAGIVVQSSIMSAIERKGWARLMAVMVLATAPILGGCDRPANGSARQPGSSNAVESTLRQEATNALVGMQASPLESTNVMRSFASRGIVRGVDVAAATVMIRHEDIPGFMPKMTMEFAVKNTNELRGLATGDVITFRVRANETESWVEEIRPTTGAAPAAVDAGPTPSQVLHAPQLHPGDAVPDFELLSETGAPVRLSDFKGRAVAFTFMFTRCPLPDYCPRMNLNFGRAREILVQRSDAPLNWQFLSISFDAEFDKPGVLSQYAYSYRGGLTNQWLFAAASTNVVKTISGPVDFRLGLDAGAFQHNLRTVVVDPNGRLFAIFEGNQWKSEELADSMIKAANMKPKE